MSTDKELTLSDLLSVYGIYLSIKNLELNLTQSDKQEMMQDVDEKTHIVLSKIEAHLAEQDAILTKLQERVLNDNSGNIQ